MTVKVEETASTQEQESEKVTAPKKKLTWQEQESAKAAAPKNKLTWLWILLSVVAVGAVAFWCVYSVMQGKTDEGVHVDGNVSWAIKISSMLFLLFLISALGYLLGRITIKGVSLGTAGVFLVAIFFGWFLTNDFLNGIPVLENFYLLGKGAGLVSTFKGTISNIGLVLFVSSVGFIAGPKFFRNLKKNAKSYVLLGAIIIVVGAGVAVLFAIIPGIGADFSAGILSGALTSTPGYSAAMDAAKEPPMVTLGHAIAYPFGVIGVVLFVQLMPKFLKADMDHERALLRIGADEERVLPQGLFEIDEFGLASFALAVMAGLLLGSVNIPLTGAGYGGPCFSLGTTGGCLIMCLVFGHFGRIGKMSLQVPEKTLKVFREFGLMLFLIGAGVDGGVSLVEQISANPYGGMIVLYGFLGGVAMTLIPMIVGYVIARYVLKMSLLNNLGSITGGMTSTPALGTLISSSKTEDVASAYASTYPIALIVVVLACQLIVTLL